MSLTAFHIIVILRAVSKHHSQSWSYAWHFLLELSAMLYLCLTDTCESSFIVAYALIWIYQQDPDPHWFVSIQFSQINKTLVFVYYLAGWTLNVSLPVMLELKSIELVRICKGCKLCVYGRMPDSTYINGFIVEWLLLHLPRFIQIKMSNYVMTEKWPG